MVSAAKGSTTGILREFWACKFRQRPLPGFTKLSMIAGRLLLTSPVSPVPSPPLHLTLQLDAQYRCFSRSLLKLAPSFNGVNIFSTRANSFWELVANGHQRYTIVPFHPLLTPGALLLTCIVSVRL